MRWSYVGWSSRVALMPTLAAALVAVGAVIDFDAEVTAISKVDGPVPLLEGPADQELGYRPASDCSEPDTRSMLVQRLQSAPFLVRIPADRAVAYERTECRPAQIIRKRKPLADPKRSTPPV